MLHSHHRFVGGHGYAIAPESASGHLQKLGFRPDGLVGVDFRIDPTTWDGVPEFVLLALDYLDAAALSEIKAKASERLKSLEGEKPKKPAPEPEKAGA